jgi:hypothetical protein
MTIAADDDDAMAIDWRKSRLLLFELMENDDAALERKAAARMICLTVRTMLERPSGAGAGGGGGRKRRTRCTYQKIQLFGILL